MTDNFLGSAIRLNRHKSSLLLPFTHATSWSNFCNIVRDGYLRPYLCPVFREKLVYFFCGAVAHRASDETLRWGRTESPVVLVFDPSAIVFMRRYFPVDTGALAAGRLGEAIKDFRITLSFDIRKRYSPWHFISTVYGTPKRYFAGEPLPGVRHNRRSLDLLLENISAQVGRSDVDYRRFSVECQTTEDVPLHRYLNEVWIPTERKLELRSLEIPLSAAVRTYSDGNCPQFFHFSTTHQ
jgi:hypothetical protein